MLKIQHSMIPCQTPLFNSFTHSAKIFLLSVAFVHLAQFPASVFVQNDSLKKSAKKGLTEKNALCYDDIVNGTQGRFTKTQERG